MRHANKKHRVFSTVGRRMMDRAPGMLLQHIINVLHARDVPLPDAIGPLVKPPDRRSQRDAVIANFSFGL